MSNIFVSTTHLEGEICSFAIGTLTIGTTKFNSQRYQRDKRLISLGNLDFYLIQLITGGRLQGHFGGQDVNAVQGDVVIIDLAQIVKSTATAGSRLTVTLPRDALNKAVKWRNIHGTVLPAHAPGTRLIAHFLKGVLKVAADLTPEEGAFTQDALINLFAAVFRTPDIDSEPTFEIVANYGLKNAIIDFISQNITSNQLSVAMIIDRFNISRAHLYRLFEPENGVSGFIKEKRLDYALQTLAKSPLRNVATKQIAFQCGFESPEIFNRLFRERFGMTPREMIKTGGLIDMSVADNLVLHQLIRNRVLSAAEAINGCSLHSSV
jgi:AraC-like DNA-binding protein